MITFYENAPNFELKAEVQPHIELYLAEVRKLLPELPDDIHIWLDNQNLIAETGEGGFAYAPDVINISFEPRFKDKKAQLESLRGTIFHEAFHLVQGHTFEKPKAQYETLLDSAIYEGCATVFEREYAGTKPLWGEYQQHESSVLAGWRKQMRSITLNEYMDEKSGIYPKWAYFDEESGERWRLYKAGTWIVDEALKSSRLDILELRTEIAQAILAMVDFSD